MKVIIAGGRYFEDYNELCLHCDKVLRNQIDIEIVSGDSNEVELILLKEVFYFYSP